MEERTNLKNLIEDKGLLGWSILCNDNVWKIIDCINVIPNPRKIQGGMNYADVIPENETCYLTIDGYSYTETGLTYYKLAYPNSSCNWDDAKYPYEFISKEGNRFSMDELTGVCQQEIKKAVGDIWTL